jgi:hypothetical protein
MSISLASPIAKLDYFPPEILLPFARQMLDVHLRHKSRLQPLQQEAGVDWMWSDDYWEPRQKAGLLLDMFGYVSTPAIIAELREALGYHDPRLTFFASISLLRLGVSVDSQHIRDLAASDEVRGWLYTRLKELGKSEMFPEEHYTQAAFARSDMVQWLIYPTELGRVPDQIELMKVVSADTGTPDGILDYYVFRFRTHPPHWASEHGWTAGVSGPYLRSQAPSVTAPSGTFSSFEPWDSKTPEEHVGSIEEIIQNWREYHFGKKD